MEVYAVIGDNTGIRSTVMRALTGCWQNERMRWIELKNREKRNILVDFTSVMNDSPEQFIARMEKEICSESVFIHLLGDDIPKVFTYLKTFEQSGWELKRLFLVGESSVSLNFEGCKTYTQYCEEPINVVAAAAREFFEWL